MTKKIFAFHPEHEVGSRPGLLLGRGSLSEPTAPTQVAAYASLEGVPRVVVVYEGSQPDVVVARIVSLNANNESLSPEIYPEPSGGGSAASVATWADGTFVVVYVKTITMSKPGGDVFGRQILARMFHPDGTPMYPAPITVAVDDGYNDGDTLVYDRRVRAPTVTALRQNYRFAVAWSTGVRDDFQRQYQSFVSFCLIDGLSGWSSDELGSSRTSATNPEYNACVQIVELTPWMLAWAYQAEDGLVYSRVKTISAPYNCDWIVHGNSPSIAALGPGIGDGFGYVVASEARFQPNPTDDKVITLDYAICEQPTPVNIVLSGRKANQLQGPRPPLTPLPTFSQHPAVAGLVGADDDMFVITWGERGNINARVFRKDGSPFSDEQTIVAAVDYNTQVTAQSIVAIPNGGFYLVYMRGVVVKEAYEYRIKAARFFLSES